ncbi:arginine--tRNA ligase [Buchnera aphidicola]|uniref:Arginine--tRNA ligase n=1 Tax=Buchnera aphidicola (Cinara strobi) TaxID=1921549 RepID=A0A3B1E7T7_9GAMM|nr:arginine--tRNA ligase [Buchnera aphidicola]VAX76477.1 Arginine--tRNA ligase [Buchnera aphidicola (Cinara strobi)]
MNIQKYLKKKIQQICIKNGLKKNFDPLIKKNIKSNDIDYQINGIIKLKNTMPGSLYELAKKISCDMEKSNIYKKISVSKNGFINITLRSSWLCKHVNKMFISKNLNISKKKKKTIVIDYSSPNIAKNMHIGHLRSTILGDVTARVMEFLGHNVIKQNHIGDWGTPFGMLITQFQLKKPSINQSNDITYHDAYLNYKKDPFFASQVKKNIVKLQKKNKKCLKIWNILVQSTIKKNKLIYKKLNVSLTDKDIRGESYYHFMIPEIISDLKKKKIAIKYNKCTLVYLKKFTNRLGKKMGVIIKKKDGAFLYTTTDLACLKYRCETLHADRIIYYIDSRQKQHLLQVWDIAKQANYIPKKTILEHHSFGMILDKNKKPFKTRNGITIQLMDLLNESISRAKKIIIKKNNIISNKDINKISERIGIGSIKYFDLSKNRTLNYIFNWDQMLSLEGNTALYILYAYTRIQSIMNKGKLKYLCNKNKIKIFTNYERKLTFSILQFEKTLLMLEKYGTPHLMCNYLYDLAEKFSKFYENCSILSAKEKHIKASRMKLSSLTAKVIKKGLYLLGIKTVKKM